MGLRPRRPGPRGRLASRAAGGRVAPKGDRYYGREDYDRNDYERDDLRRRDWRERDWDSRGAIGAVPNTRARSAGATKIATAARAGGATMRSRITAGGLAAMKIAGAATPVGTMAAVGRASSGATATRPLWHSGHRRARVVGPRSDEVSSWFGDEQAERRRQEDERRREMYRGRGRAAIPVPTSEFART